MSSSNAIGSASVILSANADGLAAGLDKAERKVQGFAGGVGKKLDKAGGGSGGGGFLGKLLGGAALAGAAGAAGAIIAKGIMKGFEVLAGIPDLIRSLAETSTGPEAGPLRGIVRAMDQVGEIAARVGGQFFAAFGPGILAVTDLAGSLSSRFGGLIQQVGAGLGAAFTVGVELAGELLTVVGELLESFVAWATGITGVSNDTAGAASAMFAAFRMVGKGAAYVWDTIRAGAGVIAWVAGRIVEGLGHVVEAFRSVVDLAQHLPDAIRPDWIGDFADGVEGTGRRIREVGEGISGWGRDAVAGFGQSAAAVDRWMDGVEGRFAQRRSALERTAAMTEAKLAGALVRGTQAEYSAVTKFNTNAMVSAADPARRQERLTEETNRLLRDVARALAGAAVLRTV